IVVFFFSSRRRHTRSKRDWSSDVCSSDLLQSQGNWLIQSNAELGEGYSDISICTSEKIGIIIELKYAEDGNLEKGCEEALKQIEEKKYAAGLKWKGMKKIIKYGIAFCEKECMVVMA